MLRKKKGQLDDQVSIEIERHHSVQDSRKFYKRLKDTRKPFESAVAMWRATNGQLLTNKDQVLSRWKEYFEQHLNESSEVEPHTNQEKMMLLSICRFSKGNKAAGSDSIAANLLKSGGPSLINALNEMIQQVWYGETLPESWT
jgi:myosin heavy subunit